MKSQAHPVNQAGCACSSLATKILIYSNLLLSLQGQPQILNKVKEYDQCQSASL